MRYINEIIVHCSATPEGKDYHVDALTAWHRQRGFRTIGYNYVIYLDGSTHIGRPLSMVGAHCKGHNAHSIGICYIGGVAADGRTPKDTRTKEQRKALALLLRVLHAQFPKATLHGHREFVCKRVQSGACASCVECSHNQAICQLSNKACPSFDCHEYDYIFNIESV